MKFRGHIERGLVGVMLLLAGCATTAPPAPEPVPAPVPEPTPAPEPTPPVVEAPAPVLPRALSYTVEVGDNLWDIASRARFYGDAYQWPLIFRNNRDRIVDADLIYPGQVLTIELDPSAAEVGQARRHARERGPWSLGVVEDSDRAYLRRYGLD